LGVERLNLLLEAFLLFFLFDEFLAACLQCRDGCLLIFFSALLLLLEAEDSL